MRAHVDPPTINTDVRQPSPSLFRPNSGIMLNAAKRNGA